MLNDLLNRYVALWNQPDPEARRSEVATLWASDGLHYTQTRQFRGIEALDARVTEAHDEFVVAAGLRFVSGNDLVSHHNVAKFSWQMMPRQGGDVLAVGFDFLILDTDGRILVDYQFNEPPPESGKLDRLALRYLTIAEEPDEAARSKRVGELYAPQARLVDESAEHVGHPAILASIESTREDLSARGLIRRLAGPASAQHNAVRFKWQLEEAGGGDVLGAGFDFLVRDDQGLVTANYRFTGRPWSA